MKLSEVFAHFGSQAETARKLGINRASITEWVKNQRIPIKRQWQIELITDGRLKATQHTEVA